MQTTNKNALRKHTWSCGGLSPGLTTGPATTAGGAGTCGEPKPGLPQTWRSIADQPRRCNRPSQERTSCGRVFVREFGGETLPFLSSGRSPITPLVAIFWILPAVRAEAPSGNALSRNGEGSGETQQRSPSAGLTRLRRGSFAFPQLCLLPSGFSPIFSALHDSLRGQKGVSSWGLRCRSRTIVHPPTRGAR